MKDFFYLLVHSGKLPKYILIGVVVIVVLWIIIKVANFGAGNSAVPGM